MALLFAISDFLSSCDIIHYINLIACKDTLLFWIKRVLFVFSIKYDIEYFDTIEEACDHLSVYIGKPVDASWQALNEAADEWNDKHPDSDWSINVKQIEVISDDEMCSLTDWQVWVSG